MLRFLINGEQVNSPGDWEGFEHEFVRDYDTRSIGVTYGSTIRFSGQAHALLLGLQQAGGICAEADIEIQDECDGLWVTAVRGKLFLSEAKWNETQCTVEIPVEDNSIGARIDNNKGIPVSPTSPLSKNGVEITPVTPIMLEFHDPDTGTALEDPRRVFDWMECVKHAIQYMSDGEIVASSEWYDNLPDDERYAIAYGNELRVPGLETPRFVYAWKDLFYEVAKKYNLWYHAYEGADGQPLIRIEPEGTFFSDEGDLSILNIQGLERYMDTDRLPASVLVGSSDEIVSLATSYSLPFVVLNGHSEESFHFTGVCNTDEELDLTNKWQIGNNVIEDVVINGSDDYDKDYFIIQYDHTLEAATKGYYLALDALPALYNEGLTNFNVLGRYDLPSSAGANYAASDDSFRALSTVLTVNPTYTHPVSGDFDSSPTYHLRFDNDYTPPNFDTNNNWGNGTTQGSPVSEANSRYTPTAQGFYTFNCMIRWRIISSVPRKSGGPPFPFVCLAGRRNIRAHARVFSALGVQIAEQVFDSPNEWMPGTYEFNFVWGVSLSPGEYVEVHYTMQSVGNISTEFTGQPCDNSYDNGPGEVVMSLIRGSYIKTDFIIGGGFVEPGNISRLEVFKFDRTCLLTDFNELCNVPKKRIMIDGTRYVHPMNVKRNLATGEATWQLIRRPQ